MGGSCPSSGKWDLFLNLIVINGDIMADIRILRIGSFLSTPRFELFFDETGKEAFSYKS